MGHLGYFQSNYQHPFWYSESLVHVFHYSTIISKKKLSLYIHIPNIYLGLGFEFGPQIICDLVFACPKSLLWKMGRNWKYLLKFTHLFFGVINVDPRGITFNINVFNVYVVDLEDQIFDFAFCTNLSNEKWKHYQFSYS